MLTRNLSRTAPERLQQPATRAVNAANASRTKAATSSFREILTDQGPNGTAGTAASGGSSQNAHAPSESESPVSGLAGLAMGTPTPAASNTTAANAPTTRTASGATATPWTPVNSAGPHDIPTVEQLFGASPWLENPTGYAPDGKTWSYNPRYFASRETAEKVANMVGGTVIEQSQFCPTGPLLQSQPNEMVQLANGRVINAGEFVSFFSHGYPQYYVDHLIEQELKGEVA